MSSTIVAHSSQPDSLEQKIAALIARMSLADKIGQMCQVNPATDDPVAEFGDRLRAGRIGSVINLVDVRAINELQRIAVKESPQGIPLLIGRDVIHGFATVLPIPLGQAATWNPALVREASGAVARETAAAGVNWTFAPMIDICRDARWGRIAESFGEDPYLTSQLGVAMVRGFQGDDLSAPGSIAACVKHFVGYGASEGGRDYAATNIPENELRNAYLPPFKAALDAGAASLMTSFGDMDGVPATASDYLLRDILRDEWGFDGLVVSDWNAVEQLAAHGFTANRRESALAAARAGVDMEMTSDTYAEHLESLVAAGEISIELVDAAVANILRMKFRLGLFDRPCTDGTGVEPTARQRLLDLSREMATQSVVLLKNESTCLPLDAGEVRTLAVIGPLADAPQEQLGTWVFDGDAARSITPLAALRDISGGRIDVRHHRALVTSRSRDCAEFGDAAEVARDADAIVVFLGEESILSGEAHSRANIDLPGAQAELVHALAECGKPLIGVVLAGRPLTLGNVIDELDALLYAWHPGTMSGPAIADLLFGLASPSGRLPVTFPLDVGQIPIYYNHKNTGRPPESGTIVHIDDIDAGAPQTSFGMTSFYLDSGFRPRWPFGFGLGYTTFEYSDLDVCVRDAAIDISATLENTGRVRATEVAQLYVRDPVASVTRPVRELKGFQRVPLDPGESARIAFSLPTDDLAFHGRSGQRVLEAGEFHLWLGGSSEDGLNASFRLEG